MYNAYYKMKQREKENECQNNKIVKQIKKKSKRANNGATTMYKRSTK